MAVTYGSTRVRDTKSTSLSYILTTPKEMKEEERLPLIVFLHGAGERGEDLEKLKVYCVPKLFTNGKYENAKIITVSPQCPANTTWIDYKNEVIALIDEIIAKYPVDEKRVSLCGISMGGFGTWEIAMTFPNRFHKIAPLCGGGMNWRAWALTMPIRVYHGRRDDVVPLSQSEAMVNSVKIQGGNVEFTVYDDLSHNCWDRAFEETDLIEWLIS
ncbi:MAG: dienelactone hydrolase family protein [Clostridia bacterium]|nr:dienelactone hydrolase family protein [Clostridia bacterium]